MIDHSNTLKDNSLKAAGYAYLVGDAALFASGVMAGRYKEAATGAIWAAGGLACARYGNPNADAQYKLLSHKLGDYLHAQGVVIPNTPDTNWLAQEGGVIEKAEAFLYRYPSQILNGIFAASGLLLVNSGIQHNKKWDTAAGALVVAGGLAGLLIPEKKPDPNHPPESALEKTWAWVQEKPLRVTGALYTLNNAAMAMSAIDEVRNNPGQKSYLFKFLTAASYVFANSMLALSKKDGGGKEAHSRAAMQKLADASAHVIASQPKPLQEEVLQHISGFLAAQPHSNMSAHDIAQLLHEKLAATPVIANSRGL